MNQLNLTAVILAILAFALSSYINHKRATAASTLPRLQALKRLLGDAMGDRTHWLVYVVLPFLLGIVFVIKALRGHV